MSKTETINDEKNKTSESAVTPPDDEKTAQETAAADTAADKKKMRSGSAQGGVWFMILLLLLGLLSGAYFFWQQLQEQQEARQFSEQKLHKELQALGTAQADTDARLKREQQVAEQLRAEGELLGKAVEQMSVRLGRDRHAWTLAEADYLMQIASRRLQLERDVRSALVALAAADQRLARLNEPLLTSTRERLSEALQALRAIPSLDLAGIALELGALSKGVETLELAGTQTYTESGGLPVTEESPPLEGWRQLLQTVWNDLRSLLIIHRHETGSLPLITPDQRLLLQQNLRLKLETARLALLRGEAAIYQAALSEADVWIADYYLAEAAASVAMRDSLARLRAIDIVPPLPDISAPLHALREASEQIEYRGQP